MKDTRKMDPYLDRRSGDDRRHVYDMDYYLAGGMERRLKKERRRPSERRTACIRVTDWSSVCPDDDV